MRKKRSRFALLGILALALTVTAGVTVSDVAMAKKKGGGGTKTITKAGAPIPDAIGVTGTAFTGNGGQFHLNPLVSVITVGRKFASAKIKDLNVGLQFTHGDLSDVAVDLIGANGQWINLTAFNANFPPGTFPPTATQFPGTFGPTTFDDQAALFINDINSCPAADPDPPGAGATCTGKPDGGSAEARPPYAGSFKPQDGTLASLGSKLMGKWVLLVYDGDPFVGPPDVADIGTLTNWKLIAQLKGGGKKK